MNSPATLPVPNGLTTGGAATPNPALRATIDIAIPGSGATGVIVGYTRTGETLVATAAHTFARGGISVGQVTLTSPTGAFAAGGPHVTQVIFPPPHADGNTPDLAIMVVGGLPEGAGRIPAAALRPAQAGQSLTANGLYDQNEMNHLNQRIICARGTHLAADLPTCMGTFGSLPTLPAGGTQLISGVVQLASPTNPQAGGVQTLVGSQLLPGMSGGPIINPQGQVVGLLRQNIGRTIGMSFEDNIRARYEQLGRPLGQDDLNQLLRDTAHVQATSQMQSARDVAQLLVTHPALRGQLEPNLVRDLQQNFPGLVGPRGAAAPTP